MGKIPGMILLKQTVKTLKSTVGKVGSVIDATSRRMRNENIHPPVAANLRLKFQRPQKHLPFRILKFSVAVSHTAAQPGNSNSLKLKHLTVNAGAAVRRRVQITVVMVSIHI